MIKSKVAEPFRKLRLLNFKTSFERGDKVNVFIGDASKMLREDSEYANGEINPIFSARIPRIYINLVVSLMEFIKFGYFRRTNFPIPIFCPSRTIPLLNLRTENYVVALLFHKNGLPDAKQSMWR
jgi:hypothetical protein